MKGVVQRRIAVQPGIGMVSGDRPIEPVMVRNYQISYYLTCG